MMTLLALLLLVGCSDNNLERNTALESDFSSLIAMVSGNSNSEIHISAFIDFEWDKAFLFSPYTPHEELEQKMGVRFNNPSGIDWREDIYLIVFLHDEIVVQYAELSREQADFSISEADYLTPSNDSIIIIR